MMLCPVVVKAQKNDSLIISVISRSVKGEPMYTVDDTITSKEEVSKIETKYVQEFKVVKPPQSVILWGNKAKDGMVIITSVNKVPKTDYEVNASAVLKKLPHLIFVDNNNISPEDLGHLNPALVEELTILKGENAIAKFGTSGAEGVLIIITKKFARASYQEKFAVLSDDYQKLIVSLNNDDTGVIYVLNNVSLENEKDRLGKLYHINKDEIASLNIKSSTLDDNKNITTVTITTKK
jgi:hypothetical protein